MRAVRTPRWSSGPLVRKRTAVSAANVNAAPPGALTIKRREGLWPTARLKRCGTTNPTKPMTPATETEAPTAKAVPIITRA